MRVLSAGRRGEIHLLRTCPADVLDDVAENEVEVLINNEVPDLDLAKLVVIRVLFRSF